VGVCFSKEGGERKPCLSLALIMADGQSQSKRSFKKWFKKLFNNSQSQSIQLPGSGQVNRGEASSVQHVVLSSKVGALAATSQQGVSDAPLSYR
jgi:hypothetical protein